MYYENFEELCKRNNVKPSAVSKATGIATSTLTEWKKGRYTPKQEKLQLIADFFGVTVDYLINGKPESGHYLSEEALKEAQEMYEDPDMRSLFSAKKKMSKQGFNAWKKSFDAYYEAEQGISDEGC